MYQLFNIPKSSLIIADGLNIFFVVLFLVVLIYIIFCLRPLRKCVKKIILNRHKPIYVYLLICSLLFILFALVSPSYFLGSSYAWDLQSSSNISTVINGLMSPFIAIAAAILTFMAFLVQYNANNNIHNENNKQQEERRFYELLKIHREMVKEFEWEYSDLEKESPSEYTLKNNMGKTLYKVDGNTVSYSFCHYRGQSAIGFFFEGITLYLRLY